MTVVVLRDHYTCPTRQQMLHNATTVTKVKVQSRRKDTHPLPRTTTQDTSNGESSQPSQRRLPAAPAKDLKEVR